jgi:hypothetical protein
LLDRDGVRSYRINTHEGLPALKAEIELAVYIGAWARFGGEIGSPP